MPSQIIWASMPSMLHVCFILHEFISLLNLLNLHLLFVKLRFPKGTTKNIPRQKRRARPLRWSRGLRAIRGDFAPRSGDFWIFSWEIYGKYLGDMGNLWQIISMFFGSGDILWYNGIKWSVLVFLANIWGIQVGYLISWGLDEILLLWCSWNVTVN